VNSCYIYLHKSKLQFRAVTCKLTKQW